jgi:flagellar biogenesis protein FliO
MFNGVRPSIRWTRLAASLLVACFCVSAVPAAGQSGEAVGPDAAAARDRAIPLPAGLRPLEGDTTQEGPIAPPSGSMSGDAVRTVGALAIVLALAFVLKGVVRRLGDPLAARRPSGVVQVLARFPFGRGQNVVLMSIGTRVLCLHQSAQQVRTLCEMTDPNEIALLRARIEAGSDGGERFERELIRSLERTPSTERTGQQAQTTATNHKTQPGRRGPRLEETIDLTRDRSGGLLGRLGRFIGGGRP